MLKWGSLEVEVGLNQLVLLLNSSFTLPSMADDFDAAASWLSSNPSAATLPNETKLEVRALTHRKDVC